MPSTISRPKRSRKRSKIVGRQRLGGRDAHPDRAERVLRPLRPHERAVQRRHGEEDRRAPLAQDGEQRVRLRRPRAEHRRRAEVQRERQVVAQPVGVLELRRREQHVVLAHAEHLPGVRLARDLDVVVEVHDALRAAGRARAVQPEGHVVAVRRGRDELVVLGGELGLEVDRALRRAARRDEREVAAVEHLAEHRDAPGVGDHDPRVAVVDEVAEVVGLVERAHRDGDGAEPHRPEEHDRERGRVVEDEQHPLLPGDAERAEQVARSRGLREQLAVGQRPVDRVHGRLAGAAPVDVPVEQQARVEALRCGDDVDGLHAPSRRRVGFGQP